jgi:hypothetical protein
MAFLVCYSEHPPDDHCVRRALYLDQEFYRLIFQTCRLEASLYPCLVKVASLRYKSPTLVIERHQLAELGSELVLLESSGHPHPQIADLRQVIVDAVAGGCALTISGDMYPEL